MESDHPALCANCQRPGEWGTRCERSEGCIGYHHVHRPPEGEKRDLNIGLKFGNYLVLRRLGAGAMGAVYRAYDQNMKRNAAFKIMNAGEASADFEHEVQTLVLLDKPHIVRLYDYGQADGDGKWLAMEYIDGKTLAQAMPVLSRPEQRDVIRQIGIGLAYAHEVGRIHRDLKPANIMLQEAPNGSWHVDLIDFGLAKNVTVASSTRRPAGTPKYWAPEQAQNKHLGPWTDLYALALIIIEMFVGLEALRPLRDELNYALRISRKKIAEGATLADELLSGMPAPFHEPLRRALSVEPEKRPPLGDFLKEIDAAFKALTDVVIDEGALTHRDPRVMPQSPPVATVPSMNIADRAPVLPAVPEQSNAVAPSRDGRRLLLGVVLLCAIAGALGAMYVTQEDRPESPSAQDAAVHSRVRPPLLDAAVDVARVDAGRLDKSVPNAAVPDAAMVSDAAPPTAQDAAPPTAQDAAPPTAQDAAPESSNEVNKLIRQLRRHLRRGRCDLHSKVLTQLRKKGWASRVQLRLKRCRRKPPPPPVPSVESVLSKAPATTIGSEPPRRIEPSAEAKELSRILSRMKATCDCGEKYRWRLKQLKKMRGGHVLIDSGRLVECNSLGKKEEEECDNGVVRMRARP